MRCQTCERGAEAPMTLAAARTGCRPPEGKRQNEYGGPKPPAIALGTFAPPAYFSQLIAVRSSIGAGQFSHRPFSPALATPALANWNR